MPRQPPVSYSQTQATQEDSRHFPTQLAQQQQQQIVRSKTRSTHSALPSISHDGGHGPGLQGAHGSSVQDGLEGGSILKIIDKQNEIAALLVQQQNLSSPREVPFFDGDPLR